MKQNLLLKSKLSILLSFSFLFGVTIATAVPNNGYFNPDSIYYKIFKVSGDRYGYDIYRSNKVYIHQPIVPGKAGQEGFTSFQEASAMAFALMGKLKNKMPVSTATNNWTQKSNFPGGERYGAFSFSIGNRGFVGTGIDNDGYYQSDCWQYNPEADFWTRIADFGGGIRAFTTNFTIKGKSYVGTGVAGSYDWRKDFWEFDTTGNVWKQVADFGGGFRYTAVSFSIGDKGYVGTGNYRESPGVNATYYNDFWEFDPTTGPLGTWTSKAAVPEEGRSSAVGFSLNGKGYIGTGFYYYDTRKKDFWEFDPSTNNWSRIQDLPGTERYGATSFIIGSKAYIGLGWNYTGLKDFWEFDPSVGTWTSIPDLPGAVRHIASAFSIGDRAYIGFGSNENGVLGDIWQYGSTSAPKLPSFQFDPMFVSNYSGSSEAGYRDGSKATALFNGPIDIATDRAGNTYVSDQPNHRIRKISVSGNVTTLAGDGTAGYADGNGINARFNNPWGIAVDDQGNIYVADYGNQRIRKITADGNVSTIAGDGNIGFVDGPASIARFYFPYDVAVDKTGSVFVSDHSNNRIRKISTTGIVSTFAGNGRTDRIVDGIGTEAQFYNPEMLNFDSKGFLYVTESYGPMRKISESGFVSSIYISADSYGSNGFQSGLVIDSNDNIYVSVTLDAERNFIVKHTPGGKDMILAGSTRGYEDGIGTHAKFYNNNGLTIDSTGDILVADAGNHRIRKIAKPVLTLTSLSGINSQPDSFLVSGNNLTSALRVGSPIGFEQSLSPEGPYSRDDITLTPDQGELSMVKIFTRKEIENRGGVFAERVGLISGSMASKFLPIKGTVFPPLLRFDPINVTTLAGNGVPAYADGATPLASFNMPTGATMDPAGNFIIADAANNRIRKIRPWGLVETLAGSGIDGYADGEAAVAQFSKPGAVAIDFLDNVYVVDAGNNRIRKIDRFGNVSTFAGSGEIGFADGMGTEAKFGRLMGMTIERRSQIMYVVDNGNHCIRKITLDGEVSTLAGNGFPGTVDAVGINAQFFSPNDITADPSGSLYVTEYYGPLRKILPNGTVTTLHTPGNAFDLFQTGVAIDNMFSIYLSVQLGNGNNAIYKLTPDGAGYQIAGSSTGYLDGIGTNTKFFEPTGLAFDYFNDNIIVADMGNHRIRQLTKPSLDFSKMVENNSVAQVISFSGSYLSNNVYLSAPYGFEIAIGENAPYSGEMSISQNDGELSSVKIYIRLKNNLAGGIYDGKVLLSSLGAGPQELSVRGVVTDLIPPVLHCPATQEICYNSSNTYTIPSLAASDVSGIKSVRFSITGKTQRQGNGYDASGQFAEGRSIISWTVTDSMNNVSMCSTIVVINPKLTANIPNSYSALLGNANTIYIGYGFNFMLLSAQANGGTALAGNKYKYRWSTGSTNSYIIVSPSQPGNYTYSVIVTDAKGCETSAQKTVTVLDVRCGPRNNKVIVCEPQGRQRCINAFEVPFAVLFGNAKIGPCNSTLTELPGINKNNLMVDEKSPLIVLPNPNNGSFNIELNNIQVSEIRVLDGRGKLIFLKKTDEKMLHQLVGVSLGPVSKGMYIIQAIGKKAVYNSKLIVQ